MEQTIEPRNRLHKYAELILTRYKSNSMEKDFLSSGAGQLDIHRQENEI